MTLYLIRHAIAEERSDKWPDDAKRPLTSGGASRMRRGVAGLRTLGVEIEIVLTSPLTRAVQTAEIVVGGLKPAPTLRAMPALAPGLTPSKIGDALASFKDSEVLGLVGHEPGLGELAAWLIGAAHPLPFKKGGVCRIDVDGAVAARAGQLIWFATPKMLRERG